MVVLQNFALLIGLFGAIGVNSKVYHEDTLVTLYCGGHSGYKYWYHYKPKYVGHTTERLVKSSEDEHYSFNATYPRDDGDFVCWQKTWGVYHRQEHYRVDVRIPPRISGLYYYDKGKRVNENYHGKLITDVHEGYTHVHIHVGYNKRANSIRYKWSVKSPAEFINGKWVSGRSIKFYGDVLYWKVQAERNGTKVSVTLSNQYGSDTRSVTMIVYFVRFAGKVTGNHAGVIEHQTLIVTPHLVANPDDYYILVWERDGHFIFLGPILYVWNIKRNQTGKYSVSVHSRSSISESFDVIVIYPPSAKIIKTSNYIVCKVTLGHPANLFLNHFTHSVGKRVVRWMIIKTTRGIWYHTQKIPFNQTRYADTGLYSCGVWNEWRGKRVGGSTATLTVKTKSVPVKVQSTSEFTICKDETRDISVTFYTESKYTEIKWIHKDGRRVKHMSKRAFIVRNTNSIMLFYGKISRKTLKTVLLIRDASKESAGIYTLRVTNAYGTTNIDVRVKYDSSSDPWKHITFGTMNFCSLNAKSECYTCESNGPTPCDTPVRKIGDKIQVSCTKEVAFPTGSTKPNTFRWFISGRKGNHAWQEITRNEKVTGSRPTYKKVGKSSSSGSCYPTNIKTSTLTFTGTAKYLKQLQIRCVVSYKYGESRSVRFVNMSLCLIGGVDKSKEKIGRLMTAADVDAESGTPILGVGIVIPIAFLAGCVLSLVLTAIIVRKKDMVRRSTQCKTDKTVFEASDPSNNKSNNAREKIGESCDGTDQEEACQSSLRHTSGDDRRNTDGEINKKPAVDGEDGGDDDGTRPTDPGDHPLGMRLQEISTYKKQETSSM